MSLYRILHGIYNDPILNNALQILNSWKIKAVPVKQVKATFFMMLNLQVNNGLVHYTAISESSAESSA